MRFTSPIRNSATAEIITITFDRFIILNIIDGCLCLLLVEHRPDVVGIEYMVVEADITDDAFE